METVQSTALWPSTNPPPHDTGVTEAGWARESQKRKADDTGEGAEKAEGIGGVDSLTAAHGATDAAAEKPTTSERTQTAKPARQVAIRRRTTNAAQLQAGRPIVVQLFVYWCAL